MNENAFVGKKEQPTDAELATALGPAKAVWDTLLSELAEGSGVDGYEWKSYSVKYGWSLRVKRGKRTIVWLSPRTGSFEVLFILGAKAVSAVQQGEFAKSILEALEDAPKYPEGTGLRLQVKSARPIGALKKLAALKIDN